MLVIDHISFSYERAPVLNELNFSVKKGEHLSIMGESGCGKSTLLKAIYGLLTLEKGCIKYDGKSLLGPEHHLVPGHSFMKYLTQELNVMPYISVADNVGEYLSRFYPQEREKRTQELLNVVGLTEYYTTHARYLSGGQKQRVALAKVLAKEPEILLLDEPFSQIDHFKKNELRYQLFEYLKEKQITCITATHDSNDVLPFAGKVLIMRDGKQWALDTPKRLYLEALDTYTASLFSEINVLHQKEIGLSSFTEELILYPHQIKVEKKYTEGYCTAIVKHCYFRGSFFMIHLDFNSKTILSESKEPFKIGERVSFTVRLNNL